MPSQDPPDSFLCPITRQVMTDPVCDSEGNSFEREAIVSWLSAHGTSPITRTPMDVASLVPNRVLKDAIDSFLGTGAGTGDLEEAAVIDYSDYVPGLDSVDICVKSSKIPANYYYYKGPASGEEYQLLHISLVPAEGLSPGPVDVSCVIDISGSMGTEATVKTGAGGETESFGLSILDIVKHSVKTIIKSLSKFDRLALVSFSDYSNVEFPLTPMDPRGQDEAIRKLESLQPTASTNLWAGLMTGLEVLKEGQKGNDKDSQISRLATTLVFTDGVPNVIPPRGHVQTLQLYREQCGGTLPGSVNTFGFGYNLESQTLYDLAKEGQGSYAFIPDSAFVGTIFVHAVANLMSTMARKVKLTLEPVPNSGLLILPAQQSAPSFFGQAVGHGATTDGLGSYTIDLGSIQYGQSKDLVVLVKTRPDMATDTPVLKVWVSAETRQTSQFSVSVVKTMADLTSNDNLALAQYHHFRQTFVETVKAAMGFMIKTAGGDGQFYQAADVDEQRQASILIKTMLEAMRALFPTSNVAKNIDTLVQDISGQVTEAFKPDYFERWGRHYLPSLCYAHLHQICNNFKDPGVQGYGGSVFRKVRDSADMIFCRLPPPTYRASKEEDSSHAGGGGGGGRKKKAGKKKENNVQGSAAPAPQFDMSMFNNPNSICFHKDSLVQVWDDCKMASVPVPISHVVKGDKVAVVENSGTMSFLPVLYVLESEPASTLIQLSPSGLKISPWHPVKLDGEWVFPATQEKAARLLQSPDPVYNLLFVAHDCPISVLVDGVECVPLGHGREDTPVCKHPFLSDWKLVNKAISGLVEDAEGKIRIAGVKRCTETGMISGFLPFLHPAIEE